MARREGVGHKVLAAAVAAVMVAALAVFGVLPTMVGRNMNGHIGGRLAPVSAEATALQASLDIADLHGDALLWDRSLVRRGSWGHLDMPRMVEGRIAVEIFTTVTKVPRDMNIESNSGDSDNITLLAMLQGWPPRTWSSLTERALYQADKLRDAEADSEGGLRLITTAADLDAHMRARREGSIVIGAFLGIEGAHALEGALENLDRLYDAGFRMVGLAHFFDNRVGGSAHGAEKAGLTSFGADVVERMDSLGMLVDLAHSSEALIDDALARVNGPVVVSHGGVAGVCDNARNVTDEHVLAIATTGGMIGIGLWETALCGDSPAAWARSVRYVADLAGVDHVGLGSDWDGAVATVVDASGTVYLVQALLDEGFSEDEVRKIMGENAVRVLREVLGGGVGAP